MISGVCKPAVTLQAARLPRAWASRGSSVAGCSKRAWCSKPWMQPLSARDGRAGVCGAVCQGMHGLSTG